jgi:hypothetical protein
MIHGVLTERTVKEVIPMLKTTSEGLKKTLEELVKQYKAKQDEMEAWKVGHSFVAFSVSPHANQFIYRRRTMCRLSSSPSR